MQAQTRRRSYFFRSISHRGSGHQFFLGRSLSYLVSRALAQLKSTRGFTMIELLVVIGIMSILVTAGFSSYTNSQRRGRDARRKTDLETVRQALELYKSDNASYPNISAGTAANLSGATGPLTTPTQYINPTSFPSDPQNASGRYYYYRRNTTTTYDICTRLEVVETSPNSACTSVSCGTPGNCNYGLLQP